MAVYNNLPSPSGDVKHWIYDHGTEYYGGLVAGLNAGVTPTRTKYTDYYYMGGTGTSSQGTNGSIVTNEKVNLTGYSKVGVLLSNLSLSGNVATVYLMITNSKTDWNGDATRVIATGGNSGNNTASLDEVKLEFDIEDLSGEYYVALLGTTSVRASFAIELAEMYLIK